MENSKQVTTGLVLRQTETKEADIILTVLTPDLGKIPLIARGARRKNSKIAAACQPLVYSEMTVYQRGEWYYLSEADTVELFAPLRQDLIRLSLASYFAELTEAVSAADTAELLPLLLNALYALAYLPRKEPQLIKAAFELRVLTVCGLAPLCDQCAVCGAEDVESPVLDASRGVVTCLRCRPGEGNGVRLLGGTLNAMRYIISCDPKKLYHFRLNEEELRSLSAADRLLLKCQLERDFRTLDYYNSLICPKGVHYE